MGIEKRGSESLSLPIYRSERVDDFLFGDSITLLGVSGCGVVWVY